LIGTKKIKEIHKSQIKGVDGIETLDSVFGFNVQLVSKIKKIISLKNLDLKNKSNFKKILRRYLLQQELLCQIKIT